MLTRECLDTGRIPHHLHMVEDGHAAMAYLRREGRYADAPRPDIILLDLNLPQKDGREVLQEVKADQHLRAIPVVIHSSSQSDEDVTGCYFHHANCYIPKAVDFGKFQQTMEALERFWLKVARLPSK